MELKNYFKVVFFLLIVISWSGVANAQIGYGPEYGTGIATMKFVPPALYNVSDVKPVFSFRVGGVVDIPLNKRIYFQTGLFFSRRGSQRNFSFSSNDSNYGKVNQTLLLNYMSLPMSVIVKSDVQGKLRVFAGLGVCLSNLVGGRNKISNSGDTSGVPFQYSFSNRVSTQTTISGFDAAMNIEAGIEMPTGLFFKLYYVVSISDIGLGTETDKNRMFGISSGWYLGKFRNINRDDDNLIDSQVE